MSVNLVGKERLRTVLDESQRITVLNLTSDRGLTINAFVLALHAADGSVRYRTSVGAPLAPDDTLVIDDDRPVEEKIVAVEAFMRLTDSALALITDAYVKVEVEGNATSLGDIELGVCYDDEELEDATPIDEAPRYAVFARGTGTD
jgi:hypothetical protein